MANALAIFAAEKILRIVPEGAHDWNKFVKPEELQKWLEQSKLILSILKYIYSTITFENYQLN